MSKLYTADRFVTIGGTTAQYVTGTGSLVTFPAIPSGADYIQNQIASAQSANMWISGSAYVGATNLFSSGIIRQDISGTTFNQLWYSGSSVGTVNTDGLNISYNATSALTFGTGGTTERMRITGAGNVGIGTSSPTAKLHVEGNATPGNYAAYINNASGGGNVLKLYNHDWDVADYLLYATNGGGHSFVVDGNGKVGIGTTSPGAKLDVRGGATNTEGGDIYSSNRSFAWSQYINGSTGSYSLYNGSDRLVITTAGNVGIGTSSPAYKLHVAGEIYNNYRVQINDGTANLLIGHWDGTNTRIENSGGRDLFITSYSSAIKFGIDGSENMRIATNGNIGVGTSSPSYKLDIDGALRASSGILNSNSCFERVLGTPYFTHGVSDLAVNINLGNLSFWGYIEVEVTGAYSNQNTPGKLTKLFAVGTNPGNLIYANESRVSDAFGPVADNMAIGEFYWDGSQYAIRLSHIVSSGNIYTVKVKMFTYGGAAKNVFDAISIGSLYSYTALAKQYPYYNDRLGIGTTSPSERLTVSGSININSEGSYIGADYQAVPRLGFVKLSGAQPFLGFAQSSFDLKVSSGTTIATSNTFSSVLTVKTTGEVGIGTTSPTSLLDVRKNQAAYTYISVDNAYTAGSGVGSGFAMTESGTVAWYLRNERDGSGKFNIGNTSNRLTIDSTGNVGIGTSSPNEKLEVNGTVLTTATLGSTAGSYAIDHPGINTWKIGVTATNSSTFHIGNDTGGSFVNKILNITSAGNVGIGITSPSEKLDVDGSIRIRGNKFLYFDTTAGGPSNYIGVTNDFWTTIYCGRGNSSKIDLTNGSGILFSESGSERMRIAAGGNVGIGTSSPSTKLDINGNARVYGANLLLDFTVASGGIQWGINPYIQGVANGGFEIRDNTNGLSRLVISGTGNVGIGTTSPSEKLEVNGSIRLSDGNADGPQLKLASSGYSDWNLDNYNGSFRAYYGSSEYFRITGSGNVGIGTTAPNAKLDVNGDALINQLTIGQGPVVGQGNTALGKGALGSMVGGKANIAVGSNANSDNDVTGLTAIGVDLNTDTNLDPLGQNCLAISQFNAAAYSNQVPHIYVPSAISVGSSSIEDVITFDINHYVGAFIEYVITTSDGSEFAAGTVTVAWKDSGSGSLKDTRDVIWTSYMDDFDFLLSGTTVQLRNDSAQGARIRISVRAMIRT